MNPLEMKIIIRFPSHDTTTKVWLYKWNANGSLKEVTRPDKKKVQFEYDALGRRTVKTYDGKVTRWVWDGNTPLHEWTYDEKERPKIITDEFGLTHKEGTEPTENITTWVFEEGSFRPAAKLTDDKKYSIIADYLGTPVQMYDEKGKLTWEARLDVYGKVGTFAGNSLSDCPFRYQGQYHDAETDLYYNRFRYYDPDSANYLSQDPIGLAGNNPTSYGYVKDVNNWIDVFGLSFWRGSKPCESVDFTPRPNEYKINKSTGLVQNTHGVSVFDNPTSVSNKGFIPNEIDMATVSGKLQIKQRGFDPNHYEIMPENPMTEVAYKTELSKIKCK
jgi:RHS repeat-associated protein